MVVIHLSFRVCWEVQQVQTSYSQQLEDELANINQPDDPNDYEKIIVDIIDNATNATCPIIVPADLPAPWSNTEFQQLLENRRKCKDMKEKNNLTRLIRKKREQLKNHFYKKKATQINQAAEMRNVEEEFRLIREYKMTKRFVSK